MPILAQIYSFERPISTHRISALGSARGVISNYSTQGIPILNTSLNTNYIPTIHPQRPSALSKMCQTAFHTSPTCPHSWATLEVPCHKDHNFNTCPTFNNGILRPGNQLRSTLAEPKTCPVCDKGNDYDGEKLRVVKGVVDGYRWGLQGASRTKPGFDWMVRRRKGLVRRRRGQPVPEQMCCVVM